MQTTEEILSDCRICGESQTGPKFYNIFTDELCFDKNQLAKTKIYICLNNFLYEKLYNEDENSSSICQACCNSLCDSYSFMIFVRRAEQSNWKIEKTDPNVQNHEVSIQDEEIVDDDDFEPVAASDDDDIIEESTEIVKVLFQPVSAPPLKKKKLSSGLPDSIRFTNYQLERLDKNVIIINVTAATAFQSETGNYVFDTSFMEHRDSTCVYQCKHCIKAFANSEFLLKHITAVHLCTICLEFSENYKALNIHFKSHKNIACPFCFKLTTSATAYRQHLKKQHLLHVPSHIGILSV